MGRYLGLATLMVLVSGCSLGSDPHAPVGAAAFYGPATAPSTPRESAPPLASGAVLPQDALPMSEPAVAPEHAPVTTLPPGGSFTEYQTAGALVTEVSGTPIYADKVLAQLTPKLSADAKKLDIAAFRDSAYQQIKVAVDTMIESELLYTAANRALSPDDRKLVERLTMMFRDQLVTEAGGSESIARQRARDEGIGFDELIEDQHRRIARDLFVHRKITPQITASATEIRQYYEQNLGKEFTETARAQFRVIKITAANMPGETADARRSAAIDRAKEIHDKAVNMTNEEFAELAGSFNHDRTFMTLKGRVAPGDGWVDRNAFRISEVEDAVWKIQPGQVTEPVEVGDSFYIARLEQRQLGRVQPFEDDDVQLKIRAAIEQPRRAVREREFMERLRRDAVVNPYPPIYTPVLEMALQKYAEWRSR